LLLLLALAGCHREGKPQFFDSRVPPSLSPRFFPPEGWAWGTVEPPGGPDIRYGVAAPTGVPKASVVIQANAGESAEVYFETAHDLIDRGYTVWVLDPAPSPIIGAAAIHALIDNMVRPRAGETVVLAGYDSAALAALLEAESRTPRIDGLVVWSPRLYEPLGAEAAAKVKMGLGALAADGERDWTRPTYNLSGRATLAQAWQTANPDLRPGRRPWNWFASSAEGAGLAADPVRLKAMTVPVLLMDPAGDSRAAQACAAMAHCEKAAPGTSPSPLHLAPDSVRNAWLKAFEDFVEARLADHAHGV
jgi:lysophospholipase